jgi:hypothetical protein
MTMMRALLVASMLAGLVSCSGTTTTLPYRPEQAPGGAQLAAGYSVAGDRLRIEIETDGRRLEEATILRPDGASINPQTIEHAPLVAASSPFGVGLGVGGGTFGGGVGVGTGVSVGIPVGSSSARVEGPTVAWFPLEQAGPAPWRLRVKVAGVAPAFIVVGTAPR